MDSFATPHNIIAAQSKEGKEGTKGGREGNCIFLSLLCPSGTSPLLLQHSSPRVWREESSEVSEGAALLTGVAAAAAYQNEEVVSPIETARKRMIIIVAVAAFLLFWPVSFPERFFFAN